MLAHHARLSLASLSTVNITQYLRGAKTVNKWQHEFFLNFIRVNLNVLLSTVGQKKH
jgi:hypothetical protein